MRTTVNVIIGLKQYTAIMETGEVFLIIPGTWSDKNNRMGKNKYRTIKPHTPKWYEVRQIAKGSGVAR
jgi:hypothetical protein